jgi:hypothetical protein
MSQWQKRFLALLVLDIFLVILTGMALWVAYQIFESDGGPDGSTIEVALALLFGFIIGSSAGATYVRIHCQDRPT